MVESEKHRFADCRTLQFFYAIPTEMHSRQPLSMQRISHATWPILQEQLKTLVNF